MESTNIKVSTIQFVEEQGEWSNGQQTFLKYKLHLNNGEKPEFLAKSKKTIDSFNQGDEVRYSYKKEGQSFAKIVREENNQNYNQMAKTTSNKTSATTAEMTQQESISRSVGWNNVAAIVCSPEFQKYTDFDSVTFNEKQSMTGAVFSNRQMLMLNQCVTAANVIYKELITKPK